MASKFIPVTIVLLTLMQPALALDVNHPDQPTTMEKMATKTKGVFGAVWGVTLGTPIRIMKNIHSESKETIGKLKKGIFANEPDEISSLMARVVAIPYGVARGTAIGVVKGVPEGVKKGYDEPFTYESVGMSE